jgi:hypothetical protein
MLQIELSAGVIEDGDEEGRRLARPFPNAKLVELDDCFTRIPWDQPPRPATEIDVFLTADSHGPVAPTPGVVR